MHLEAGTWSIKNLPSSSAQTSSRPKMHLTAECINADFGMVQASRALRQTLSQSLSMEEISHCEDSSLQSSPPPPPPPLQKAPTNLLHSAEESVNEEFSQFELSQDTLMNIENAMSCQIKNEEGEESFLFKKRSFHVFEEKENIQNSKASISKKMSMIDNSESVLGEVSGGLVEEKVDLFKGVDCLLEKEEEEEEQGNCVSVGFTTATGKKVKIGDSALKKAESFLGFATAGGKPVQVCEEKLNQARTFLFEGERENEQKFGGECFVGFATAAGKRVKIDEGALKKAESLLNDSTALQAMRASKDALQMKESGINSLQKAQSSINAQLTKESSINAQQKSISPLAFQQNFSKNAHEPLFLKNSLHNENCNALSSTKSTIKNPQFIPPKQKAQKISSSLGGGGNAVAEQPKKQAFDLKSIQNSRPSLESFLETLPKSSSNVSSSSLFQSQPLQISLEQVSSLVKLQISSIPDAWLNNHFSLLYWKYNSLHLTYFPQLAIQIKDIVDELLYRWQLEFVEGKRSIIQKIVEKDSSPAMHLILLVFDIQIINSSFFLVLSDGWYCIKARVDEPMKLLIVQKKIFIGQKLHIYGSILESSSFEGTSVLEAFDCCTLKIFTNATRPAHPYSRLGNGKQACFILSLDSIFADGGLIPCIDVIVQRKYPQCYFKGGSIVSERQYLSKMENRIWNDAEEMQDEIRSYTCLFKFQISDYSSNCAPSFTRDAVFTFWRASEDIIEMIKEGSRLLIYNSKATSNFKGLFTLSNTSTTYISIQSTDESIMEKCYKKRKIIDDFSLISPGSECDIRGTVEGLQMTTTLGSSNGGGESAILTLRDESLNSATIKIPKENSLVVFQKNQRIILKNVWLNFYDNNKSCYVFSFNDYSILERSN